MVLDVVGAAQAALTPVGAVGSEVALASPGLVAPTRTIQLVVAHAWWEGRE
jgi:hypothetical protein